MTYNNDIDSANNDYRLLYYSLITISMYFITVYYILYNDDIDCAYDDYRIVLSLNNHVKPFYRVWKVGTN